MSLHAVQQSRVLEGFYATYEIPERSLYVAIIENCVRTIMNKPDSFAAKADLCWLHGEGVSQNAIHPDDITEALGTDIISVLRAKFPMNYAEQNKHSYIAKYTVEEEDELLEMFQNGATKEELAKRFAPRKPYLIWQKAQLLARFGQWTKEQEEQLLHLHHVEQLKPYRIAERLKKDVRAVARKLDSFGIVHGMVIEKKEEEILVRMLKREITFDEAVKLTKKHPDTVSRRAHRIAKSMGLSAWGLRKKNKSATN